MVSREKRLDEEELWDAKLEESTLAAGELEYGIREKELREEEPG